MPNTIYDFYQLDGSDKPVYLNVTIGYAQDGDTKVELKSLSSGIEEKLKDMPGSFRVSLGTNKELNRKEVRITSLVTDIQTDFDICSVTYILTGGVKSKSWVLHQPSEDYTSYPFLGVFGLFK